VTPSDLFLSADLTEDQARAYLESLGFRDAAAVDAHLQGMADDLVIREALGRLAPELIPALVESPDPDAAVAAIARYVSSRSGRAMFLDYLREDPRALHVLTYVMGASPHLAEILIRTPEYFHWLVSQVERSAPDRQDHEEELVSAFAGIVDPGEGLAVLRRWKRRETLRIGTRDLLRHETVPTVASQLSDVASIVVEFALATVMQQRLDAEGRAHAPGSFAVIGTGALGGREMSYEPQIDILCVYDAASVDRLESTDGAEFFVRVGCDLTAALRDETNDGFLYRVGLPPWPQADGSLKACSLEEYAEHYAASDDMAERLALTRARPIAGDTELAQRFMSMCQAFVYGDRERASADKVPGAVFQTAADGDLLSVEFLTQAFQVRHGARHAALRHAGTLGALDAMGKAGLISDTVCRELDHAYIFLRSTEHRRQLGLSDNLQHQIDASRERVRSLVRTIGL
jgi:glutamate-ammonia-ligase adenylyltransferase